jgi:hypothetical protein
MIWIVERVRDEQYGQSKHVVSWHRSRDEAEGMAACLQAEFNQACERVCPWYEVVETIFWMREEHIGPEEHEEALIEQLTAWWHQESRAWQIFVEDEIMTKMIDPPRYCQDLGRHNKIVHYEYHAVSHDPAVTLAGYRERARTKPDNATT